MKTLIALMLGAFAANHLYKSSQRRRNATALADGTNHSPRSDIGAPEAGASSPNAAERLQQSQAGGAFAGVAGGPATPQPFPETGAEDGDTPRPGLPDFARGA
ncbi:hypothetical protein [Rubrivivax gelatinosus]|uniref:Uncharacterized protein n=1 Tax=Rubrivivax gelatinosus TaxID=28068 RepID=A0A4R2LWI1_RUBGE|nr:hypothetical protein [Rubrivivax gelatinosus]MBK1689148.1 hypothetical protein [Rubrivivax gelatinosus]TCO98000.1 hypothetical protein EV684_11929 [Rubrivivax gelatinosus]